MLLTIALYMSLNIFPCNSVGSNLVLTLPFSCFRINLSCKLPTGSNTPLTFSNSKQLFNIASICCIKVVTLNSISASYPSVFNSSSSSSSKSSHSASSIKLSSVPNSASCTASCTSPCPASRSASISAVIGSAISKSSSLSSLAPLSSNSLSGSIVDSNSNSSSFSVVVVVVVVMSSPLSSINSSSTNIFLLEFNTGS